MRKRLRKIMVQGMPFWWKADWFYHTDESRILSVRTMGNEKRGCPLRVNLTSKWVEYLIYSAYPLPKDISVIITYALAHGWNPSLPGEAHWLKEDDAQFELEDLILTDVGRLPQASGPLPRKQVHPAYKEAWVQCFEQPEEKK